MQAVMIRNHGDLDSLRFETLPDPIPKANEVLIQIKTVALNHLDLWLRKGVPGHTFPLPLIPGSDCSGIVRALGDCVHHVNVGDEVLVMPATCCGVCFACASGRDHQCRDFAVLGEHRNGGCAELLTIPAANVIHKPKNLSFEQGSALGVAYVTAWHMLIERAHLRPGETVLVHAAGSGVGTAAIQIAKMWGAAVIATTSDKTKLAKAQALGADEVYLSSDPELVKKIKLTTQGKGADVVFEHVGAATWETSLRVLSWHGRLVTCGATTGAEVKLDLRHLFFKSWSILGSTMGSRSDFMQIIHHASHGKLKPIIDRVLPLNDIQEAHQLLENRKIFGKIILRISYT